MADPMDDYPMDRPELSGSLISLEFGPGGKIEQMWVGDSEQFGEDDQMQFVIPPFAFGEEFSEDYFPGTVLVGARSNEADPWILSRNAIAVLKDEDYERREVTFEYELGLLPEIEAIGRFYEVLAPTPHIAWDLTLSNRGSAPLEIGELAFPLAFDNFLQGLPPGERGRNKLWEDKFHLHKCVAGAASHLFVQRLSGDPPGLLVAPGKGTSWEFCVSVVNSLNTPYRWAGIPVFYVHSRAAIEREGWQSWFDGHSSLHLKPRESHTYQTLFAPASRGRHDSLQSLLQMLKLPSMRFLPSAVAPASVGIATEILGCTPAHITTDVPAELETDSDEYGGFCFTTPEGPGPMQLSFTDTSERTSTAHLLFLHEIEDLIRQRAQWIVKHQVHREAGSPFDQAIVPTDIHTGAHVLDLDEPNGHVVVSSLCDALFLAEKNRLYPVVSEIEALNRYIWKFLRVRVQNPSDATVGVELGRGRTVASGVTTPQAYVLVALLYQTMAKVGASYGAAEAPPNWYLREAARTLATLFRSGFPIGMSLTHLCGMAVLADLPAELSAAELDDEAAIVARDLYFRGGQMVSALLPGSPDSPWREDMFEEPAFWAGRLGQEERAARILAAGYAARSLAPCWWWYGTHGRVLDESDIPHPWLFDKGESCISPASAGQAAMALDELKRDHPFFADTYVRQAFGGLLSVWALVRPDGAAAAGFCPDAASQQCGMSALTGDVGLGLWHYLRSAASIVLPMRGSAYVALGCHCETERRKQQEWTIVRPWDGVGREVRLRHLSFDILVEGASLKEMRLDPMRREAHVQLLNACDRERTATVKLRGLWGEKFRTSKGELGELDDGWLPVRVEAPANTSLEFVVKEAK